MDDGAGWHLDLVGQPSHQQFPDLPRSPVRRGTLETHDLGLELERQLIGVTPGPPRPVAQGFGAALPVAVINLVSRLPGYSELDT